MKSMSFHRFTLVCFPVTSKEGEGLGRAFGTLLTQLRFCLMAVFPGGTFATTQLHGFEIKRSAVSFRTLPGAAASITAPTPTTTLTDSNNMVQTRQEKKFLAGKPKSPTQENDQKDNPDKQADLKSPPSKKKDASTSEKNQPAKQDPKASPDEPVPDDKEKAKQVDQPSNPGGGKPGDPDDDSIKTDSTNEADYPNSSPEGDPKGNDDGEPVGDPDLDHTPCDHLPHAEKTCSPKMVPQRLQ